MKCSRVRQHEGIPHSGECGYVQHEEALRRFVRALVPAREDARDVMQEVTVVLWRKIGELSAVEDFRRWAFGVARMEALTFLRDRARDRHLFGEDVVALFADEAEGDAEVFEAERGTLEKCLGNARTSTLKPALPSLVRKLSGTRASGTSGFRCCRALEAAGWLVQHACLPVEPRTTPTLTGVSSDPSGGSARGRLADAEGRKNGKYGFHDVRRGVLVARETERC